MPTARCLPVWGLRQRLHLRRPRLPVQHTAPRGTLRPGARPRYPAVKSSIPVGVAGLRHIALETNAVRADCRRKDTSRATSPITTRWSDGGSGIKMYRRYTTRQHLPAPPG